MTMLSRLTTIGALLLGGVCLRAQQTPPSASLSPEQRAGEKLFLQRCSVCHLGSAPTYKPYGPSLAGRIEAVGEERMRTVIVEGAPGMPSWRYSLEAGRQDILISVIQTLPAR